MITRILRKLSTVAVVCILALAYIVVLLQFAALFGDA